MEEATIKLSVPWTRAGVDYAPGAVLTVPDVEAANLEAAGFAYRMDVAEPYRERETRVFETPRVAAFVGRPRGLKRRGA